MQSDRLGLRWLRILSAVRAVHLEDRSILAVLYDAEYRGILPAEQVRATPSEVEYDEAGSGVGEERPVDVGYGRDAPRRTRADGYGRRYQGGRIRGGADV